MTHIFHRTVRTSESNYVENTSNNAKTIQHIKTKFCMLILWHNWHKFCKMNFDLGGQSLFNKICANFDKESACKIWS